MFLKLTTSCHREYNKCYTQDEILSIFFSSSPVVFVVPKGREARQGLGRRNLEESLGRCLALPITGFP